MNMTVLIVLCAVFIFVIFAVYHAVKKEIQKRFDAQEKRMKELSSSEEGRKILEQESEIREKRNSMIFPVAAVIYALVYIMFFFLGIYGVFSLIHKLCSGENLKDFIFTDRGLYVLSPLLIICSLSYFVNIIKNIKKK